MLAGSFFSRRHFRLTCLCASILVLLGIACAQDADWQLQVRAAVAAHHMDFALALVNARLQQSSSDLEAHFWRGRLLAWQGQWPAAEVEYKLVLQHAPNDIDVLAALADVLLWQGKTGEALVIADRARSLAPLQPDILLRRTKLLRALARNAEAQRQYQELLQLEPGNPEARNSLKALRPETRHEFRLGFDASTFNYTGSAESQALALNSRWTPRLSTSFQADFNQRFGEAATRFKADVFFLFGRNDALHGGGALANRNLIIPQHEAFFGYSHSSKLSAGPLKGVEISYQQHWFWYQSAHVLTLSLWQIYYLPRDWTWSFGVTGARSRFANTATEWVPSGFSRLGFPIFHRLSGNVMFANGTENFAAVDQIGRFSARTFGGGLKYAFHANQDVTAYVAAQKRSQGQTQNSFGLSYGFRF